MGGDAARIVWLGATQISHTTAGTLVLIERLMGVYTLVILSAIAARFGHLTPVLENLIWLFILGSLVSLLGLYSIYRFTRGPQPRFAFVNEIN